MYTKDFDEWNKVKKQIHRHSRLDFYFKEREIWWASLGINVGSEIDGKNKVFERPVLILRKVSNHTAFVVPMTSRIREYTDDTHAFTHEEQTYNLILSQARLVSDKRLSRKVGMVEEPTFKQCQNRFIEWLIKNDSRSFQTGISEPEGHSRHTID